jgi:hypothetical protein
VPLGALVLLIFSLIKQQFCQAPQFVPDLGCLLVRESWVLEDFFDTCDREHGGI